MKALVYDGVGKIALLGAPSPHSSSRRTLSSKLQKRRSAEPICIYSKAMSPPAILAVPLAMRRWDNQVHRFRRLHFQTWRSGANFLHYRRTRPWEDQFRFGCSAFPYRLSFFWP